LMYHLPGNKEIYYLDVSITVMVNLVGVMQDLHTAY
jgi:hypothetical protein